MSGSPIVRKHCRTLSSWLFISQGEAPAPLHLVLVNFVIIAFCAGSLAIWIFLFTDWWGTVYAAAGGLAAFCGGAWAWIRRLGLPKRVQALPRWARLQQSNPGPPFRRLVKVLNVSSVCLSAPFLLMLGVTFFVGPVVIERRGNALQDHLPTAAQVFSSGAETGLKDLEFGKKRLLWASWVRRRPVTVRVPGYPDRTSIIRPWFTAKLTAPDSFVDRPVVLVLVNHLVACNDGRDCRLVVDKRSRNSTAWTPVNSYKFDAYAFWIGCEGQVQIPDNLHDQLGLEWKDDRRPQCQPSSEIQLGDSVRVTLKGSNSTLGCGALVADKLGIPDDSQAVLFVDPFESGGEC